MCRRIVEGRKYMDISYLLDNWEYDPEDSVRLVRAEDGRQVMQVRLPLGIEQYELDERPDGFRPFGMPTLLDEIERRLAEHNREHRSDEDFAIDDDSFEMLQSEGLLFYYRYLMLYQIGDYERTARDTGHNLRLCSMVERYYKNEDSKGLLLQYMQYKPYIVRVNALSRSMIALNQDKRDSAVAIIEEAIQSIEDLVEIDTTIFQFERMRSMSLLKETLEQIKSQNVSEFERLEYELETAVEEENYERAVKLRDAISSLLESDGSG